MTSPRDGTNPDLDASDPLRGGRGGLPSGSSGRREDESFLLSPTGSEGTLTVADVLLEQGVFLLSRARRLQTAARLEAAGVTPAQLARIAAWIAAGEANEATARRFLAAVVADNAQLRDALAAVDEYDRRQAAKRAARATTHYPGFPTPYWSCGCDCCCALRMRGEADKGAPPPPAGTR